MEEKYNEATPQRPDGARLLDATFVPVNLPNYIQQIKEETAYDKNGKNAITVFKSDHVTITLVALKSDSDFHSGSEENNGIMSLQVITGELTFENDGVLTPMSDGELLTLHQEISFRATAKKDTICLLTMFRHGL